MTTSLLHQYILIDRLSKQLTSGARLAHKPWSKLLSKTIGPLQISSTTQDAVTIDEEDIQNTLYIDRGTVAPDETHTTEEAEEPSDLKNVCTSSTIHL